MVKNQQHLDDLGYSEIKKQILLAAGYTPEVMGEHLAMALGALTAGLEAQRTQYFTHQGIVTDQRTDIDHAMRLKAATELASIITVLGDMKSTPNHGVGGGTQITLNVPFLADLNVQQSSIDVTPRSASPHSNHPQSGHECQSTPHTQPPGSATE